MELTLILQLFSGMCILYVLHRREMDALKRMKRYQAEIAHLKKQLKDGDE